MTIERICLNCGLPQKATKRKVATVCQCTVVWPTLNVPPQQKPRKPLNRVKRMNKVGRIGQKLIDQRREYLKAFPAPHYCYYCLYIGVEQELDEKDVQVEHYGTKNNHPGLRFDFTNLVKACVFHNKDKGGVDGDEYLEKLDKEKTDGRH